LLQLSLYNSQTRQKEVFAKRRQDPVSMYTCGPTVYDAAHVGNFRAFLTYDVLKRVLLYLGYRHVQHVCNITDVDDKILQRANEMGLKVGDISQLTQRYERQFMHDLAQLHCLPATKYPRATEHIPAMLRLVQDLAVQDLAYQTDDGSWYFDTQRQAGRYGQQLVQLNFDDMMEQKTTENADGKRHFADFCLWKAFKEGVDRDDAAWSSSDDDTDISITIQKGRPGWHLECSAMAREYFGDGAPLDFHGGGVDLKFPHHENEIAQSEGAGMPKFCNCWFHNGFVEVGNEKMSKSLGNFRTLQDACPTAADIRAYRYLVVSSQYRNPLRLTDQVMKASRKAVQRMDNVKEAIEEALVVRTKEKHDSNDVGNTSSSSELVSKTVPAALQQFEVAITDDLSMPRAAAALFSLVKAAEQEFKRVKQSTDDGDDTVQLDTVGLRAVLAALEQMDQVFGIFYQVPGSEDEEKDGAAAAAAATVPDAVMELVGQRRAAKESKDWELADSLRQRIAELGFAVKDVKDGDPIVTPVEQ